MSAIGTAPPVISTAGSFRAVDPRQLSYVLQAAALILLSLSFFAKDAIAYLCVAIPVLLPAFLWVGSGAFGIPVLPVLSVMFYLYYAMPLLGGSTLNAFRMSDVVWAALSVGLFLLAASLAMVPFLGGTRNVAPITTGRASRYARSIKTKSLRALATNDEIYRLVFVGFTGALIFYLAGWFGAFNAVGSFSGVVRAVILPMASVACYLMGFARGTGSLTGPRWAIAFGGFITITVLSMSSLFLVGGAMNIAAAMLGYLLAAKKIPWGIIASVFILLSILNAGKGEIREEYWEKDSQTLQSSSILQLPSMLVNWFVAGIGSLGSSHPRGPSLLERTSLLHMVLAVQEATPTVIPYLDGKTYELLPSMLVPRFLEPEKVDSQAVLNLLSVRYGREQAEDVSKTTIGWGMVAEAYANFGNTGVVLAGAVFGILCGLLMRMSAVASPLSVSMLIAIASTFILCNVEADFSYMMVTLFQTTIGVILFAMLPSFTNRRSKQRVPLPKALR